MRQYLVAITLVGLIALGCGGSYDLLDRSDVEPLEGRIAIRALWLGRLPGIALPSEGVYLVIQTEHPYHCYDSRIKAGISTSGRTTHVHVAGVEQPHDCLRLDQPANARFRLPEDPGQYHFSLPYTDLISGETWIDSYIVLVSQKDVVVRPVEARFTRLGDFPVKVG